MALLGSILTVGSLTMLSRLFGFVRDILIAAVLGASAGADVFFVAFKFPNLFRRLFAEGAFSMAFVPIYAGLIEEQGKDAADAFASQALAVLAFALLGFVAVIELAMPWAMAAFAPGFLANPDKYDLAVTLARITFPYLLFVSLVSLFAGVLNSLGRFAAAAATPILLNLCLIGAVLVVSPLLQSPAHALSWGVFAAGIVQLAWIFAAARGAGFRATIRWPVLSGNVRLLLRRALPVALGAGVYQINLLIDTVIASLLPDGSISYLFFADRVNQLPLGVVGVAVGTALLPLLSRRIKAGEAAEAMHAQNRAIEFSLLLTVPAATALAIIAGPIVTTLFGRGAFGPSEQAATAAALGVYALGLPAYVLIKALAPGFFARGDTAMPVKISVAAMIANLVLNLILMGPFLHVGIAMATAISSWLNAALMAWVLYRRGHLAFDARLKARAWKTVLSAAVMGAVLVLALPLLMALLAGAEPQRAIGLGILVAAGLGTFAVMAQVTGAARPADVRGLYRGRAAP